MNDEQGESRGIWLGVMAEAGVQHRRNILLFYRMNTVDIITDWVCEIK
ncbi:MULTISPECIES: hypothetical protein [Yersinia]|nr:MULTISPECIES: hypothetical protein [Yersinia]MDA5544917.1 hypothetical protein [Yersinia rochesterensis]MDN0105313.1 hypothetical protein [Yersinia rochesterensis]MDR5017263.1 hypothetical protein [Yersinia rochesterensis]UZM73423.1 hypothetical protein OP863_10500 [Yersinia sp. SCPM-O-B-9106 (C-191)]